MSVMTSTVTVPRVLIIEDDPGDALLIQLHLQEKDPSAFRIIHAESLREAAAQTLGEQVPDVILLDLNLPDSTGVTTVSKCHELFPDVPVVVLTGQDDLDSTRAAIGAGAEDFLCKGEDPAAIRKAIRYALLRHERDASERLAMTVFRHSREGIMVTDAQGHIIKVNQAFSQITGYSAEEVIGHSPSILNSGHHSTAFFTELWRSLETSGGWEGEVWNRRRDGSLFVENLTISVVYDASGKPIQYVGLFSDITQKKEQQQRVNYLAYYDALTGLPNRVLLLDRLRQALSRMRRHAHPLALAFIDLDGFKQVNDQHGHAAGDVLLQEVSQRMQACLREGDTLARLGGDEFILLLQDQCDLPMTEQILHRVLDCISRSVDWRDAILQVSASIGVRFIAHSGTYDAEQLISEADELMYMAKQQGKNRFTLRVDDWVCRRTNQPVEPQVTSHD